MDSSTKDSHTHSGAHIHQHLLTSDGGEKGSTHHDYAKANQEHFDHEAKLQGNYEKSEWIGLSRKLGRGLVETYKELFTENTTVLDYACGPGIVSAEIVPHVKSITGVDISQGMVDSYNARAKDLTISPERMHAIRTELKGTNGELDGRKFELVVCTMAYHHFTDVADTTRILASVLAPGGSLLVVDWLRDAQGNTEDLFMGNDQLKKINPHSGFTEAEMRGILDGAGLGGFAFQAWGEEEVMGHRVRPFVAKGTRV
ncbi:hypothetical protein NM688_g6183 [Phlebia brevispora]|uniref:Uncharacterized protein n=1 Tax=Phlebia brevispora TaxID=194682 RepID=A0ACC1SIV4_9APHY|nr:hypothetical protein NM688_g6183 [Phlebia brevispora]